MNDYCTGYWGAYGVLRALQQRTQVGGSWHAKVSLAQTAMWFLRMGAPLDPTDGLPPARIYELASEYSEDSDSSYGMHSRLRPEIEMPETLAYWEGSTVEPGHDSPEW